MLRKCLTSFVGVALSTLLTFGQVSADTLVFPWIVKSSTVSTIVSLYNTGMDTSKVTFTYNYKPDVSNDPEVPCETFGYTVSLPSNSIISFDAAGNVNGGRPIWGSAMDNQTISVNNYPRAQLSTFALPVTGNRRATLTVSSRNHLYGEAIVIDAGLGAAWGYVAFQADNSTDNATSYDGDCSNGQGGCDISSIESGPMVVKPYFITKVFVTPAGPGGQVGNYRAKVKLTPDPFGVLSGVVLADGSYLGASNEKTFTCTGAVDVKDFLGEAGWNTIKDINDAFFAFVTASPSSSKDDDKIIPASHAYMGKLEYTLGQGKLTERNVVNGTFNNFIIMAPQSSFTR